MSADGGPEKISTESYGSVTVTPPAQGDLQRRGGGIAVDVKREAAVRNKQDESVRVAWNQLQSGQEREGMLESAAAITFDVMQNRKRLRDAGRETVMSVLDSEVEYYGVLANRVNALNDTRIASYRLLAATGALTPEMIGLDGGKFTLPVKPLVVDFGNIDADANADAKR